MADEMDAIISEVTESFKGNPELKSAPNPSDKSGEAKPERREEFEAAEYENENDEAFDPSNVTAEQRKIWPKKYANALARRDQERLKLRSDLASSQAELAKRDARIKELEETATKSVKKADNAAAKTDAVVEGKPDINDAKYANDYGQYLEDIAAWRAELTVSQANQKAAEAKAEADKTTAANNASAEVETKIANQAKEIIERDPEVRQLIAENMDIVSNLPQSTLDLLEKADNPVIALIEIARVENGMLAFAKLPPAQAAAVIAQAQALGMAKLQEAKTGDAEADGDEDQPQAPAKKVSAAPKPMKAAKTASSGSKQLSADMTADEILETLGIET